MLAVAPLVCLLVLPRSDRHVLAALLCAGELIALCCVVLCCAVLAVDARRQHARTCKTKAHEKKKKKGALPPV